MVSIRYFNQRKLKMKNANLVLHCGATAVDRSELALAPMPEATDTYQPIAHDHFIDLVENKMRDVGFTFGSQVHSLTRNGQRSFSMVQLMNGSQQDEHALVMGVRNSYDKAFAATVLFGAYVFLCDNLSYSAEVVIGRKHTTHILRDLPDLVAAGVGQTKAMSYVQDQRFEVYRDFKLTDARADRLMIEMIRRDAINTSRFDKLVTEWYEPRVDHGPRRAWRLFNACTEALKGAPPHDMPRRTIELQAIMDAETGFTPSFQAAA